MSFTLYQQMLTKNDCYKEAKPMTPKGIVIHSTGANNPYLLRYVQPDDGRLGVNRFNNSWNRPGIEVAVHGMIGRLYNDSVACYQLLPFDIACWGVGGGKNGSYNYDPTGHIQFEICEDGLDDRNYFDQVFDTAIEFCVYLCRQYKLEAKTIVSHKEASVLGYASGHGDPDHWLAKFGKNMDWVRSEVQKRLAAAPAPTPTPKPATPSPAEQMLYRVQVGAFSVKANADAMQEKLKKAGYSAYVTTGQAEGSNSEDLRRTITELKNSLTLAQSQNELLQKEVSTLENAIQTAASALHSVI